MDIDRSIADGMNSLCAALMHVLDVYHDRDCIGLVMDGIVKYKTYSQVHEESKQLLPLLQSHRGTVAIMMENGYEWVAADIATILSRSTSVGIPLTFTLEECKAMLVETHANILLVDATTVDRGMQCSDIVMVVNVNDVHNCDEVIVPDTEDSLESVYTIMCTSGSSGHPKGAVVTRRTWLHGLKLHMAFSSISLPLVTVGITPLAHMGARASLYATLFSGGQVGFPRRGECNFSDIALIRPTEIDAPPRFFNVIQRLYQQARVKWHNESIDATRNRFTHIFGDRCTSYSAGGAPVPESLLQFLEFLFPHSHIGEGYGASECGSITDDGIIAPGVTVVLKDLPDLGYMTTDRPYSRGEVCVNTPTMVTGYTNAQATDDCFYDDGDMRFYRTGDIGEMRGGRQLRLIGRVGECFKLSQAVYVNPAKLENIYCQSDKVSDVFVAGGDDHVVAVVGVDDTSVDKDVIIVEFDRLADESHLQSWERPKHIALTQGPWHGLTTGTNKLKRNAARQRFAKEVHSLSVLDTLNVDEDDAAHSIYRGDDSLHAVELQNMLIDRFNCDVDINVILGGATASDIARYVVDGVSGAELSDEKGQAMEDWKQCSEEKGRDCSPGDDTTIVVTGATGFLGHHILDQLLSLTDVDIICLCRKMMQFDDDRVTCIQCDFEQHDLGLDDDDRHRLATVSAVYHCAAKVSWIAPYSHLRQVNVIATSALLNATPRASFHYVSSLGMYMGNDVNEDNVITLDDAMKHHRGYNLTKLLSELIVLQSSRNVTVHRPGMIGPNSVTGECNVEDFVTRVFLAMSECGLGIDSRVKFDVIPVDAVAKQIVLCSLSAKHRIYHHISTATPRLCDVNRWLIALDWISDVVPYDEWKRGVKGTLRALLPDNIDEFLATGVIGCSNTVDVCGECDVVIDEEVMGRVVAWLSEK